jgi:hypothetical protein
MAVNSAPRPRRRATRKRSGDDQNMSALTGTAWRQCLREKRVSVRLAAQLLGVSKKTAERYKRRGFEIPPLRSRRLAICFLRNLTLLVSMRDGVSP